MKQILLLVFLLLGFINLQAQVSAGTPKDPVKCEKGDAGSPKNNPKPDKEPAKKPEKKRIQRPPSR